MVSRDGAFVLRCTSHLAATIPSDYRLDYNLAPYSWPCKYLVVGVVHSKRLYPHCISYARYSTFNVQFTAL